MIVIADYGLGNLRSVQKAFEFMGYECKISQDPKEIEVATAVVLPGVGAFADAVSHLHKTGLFECIRSHIKKDKPFLGICLGFQLLFEYSEEATKDVKGLGIFKGGCKLFNGNSKLKVPQIGWNSLQIEKPNIQLFENINEGEYVYFVHSYYVDAKDKNDIIATADYGVIFDCAVAKGNLFATQFHPEKSGVVGLKMIDNFGKLTKRYEENRRNV